VGENRTGGQTSARFTIDRYVFLGGGHHQLTKGPDFQFFLAGASRVAARGRHVVVQKPDIV
jgi:hypothetical protein